jgi:hypothetical protein
MDGIIADGQSAVNERNGGFAVPGIQNLEAFDRRMQREFATGNMMKLRSEVVIPRSGRHSRRGEYGRSTFHGALRYQSRNVAMCGRPKLNDFNIGGFAVEPRNL